MSLNRETPLLHLHIPFGLTYCVIIIFCIVMVGDCGRKGAPRWWNVVQLLPQSRQNRSTSSAPKLSVSCSKIPGLVPKQLRFCRDYAELMQSIAKGAKSGINECKYQFKGRRWNCSTTHLHSTKAFKRKSIFGRVLDIASRETAFVHAMTTAGVAYSVTRACSSGYLSMCGCDPENTPLPAVLQETFQHRKWMWGGCSDHTDFGMMISREFVDANFRVNKARPQMNLHNNEAGREILKSKMWLKCKCHGLSGSCDLETCWWSMPSLRRVGAVLKERYDEASEMTVKKHEATAGRVEVLVPKYPSYTHPGTKDLIYYENSPNYCEPNIRQGILGTRGRRCNATSEGTEGCDLLCCGRGHESRTVTTTDRCSCVFHWCCHVTCQQCTNEYHVHTCK